MVFILVTLLGGFYAVDVYFGGKMPELMKYVRDQVTFRILSGNFTRSFDGFSRLFCFCLADLLSLQPCYKTLFPILSSTPLG